MTDICLSYAWARQHHALLTGEENRRTLWCRQDVSLATLAELARLLAEDIPLCLLDESAFEQKLLEHYQQGSSNTQKTMDDLGKELDFYSLAQALPATQDLLDEQDDAPIIRLLNAMLSEAIKERASDIHIETYDCELVIRFRIDGVLKTILKPQHQLAALLTSRIKVMSKLDIAEKRIPQDGRITLKIGGRSVDVRVSVLPTNHGERVVMRLLDKSSVSLDLAKMGVRSLELAALTRLVHQPHGVILVTGPTGSGKSTTLYALLMQINDGNRNIMTIEDPVEFELKGISQTQVNTRVDMTFARGLRALLRQDPDVVLLGEIRDTETAHIAVQASLTGHLVLSTLHTNTAIGAITRLRDMGIEPFLLASSLTGILAQRLVRKLCPHCRQPYALSAEQAHSIQLSPEIEPVAWRPVGCEKCHGLGYRGRLGIHELLLIDDAIRKAIHLHSSEQEIEQLCGDARHTLRQDGVRKLLMGETSIEEVLRVTGGEPCSEV
ncbi:type II secretion system ATPase GspE [Serratia proteamaculans]|uniref:Type II secretion system protein E n=1 Tax=Serratia proteamaculans TaxID=28151 RepID=A0A7U0N2G2_SERPR|nr:type II secretion system ATPase GspE [Serratia proteamaculans]MBO1502421.1 type II secretion system ATPase GspE [Serratia proteamaculans]MDW5511044.1 type II secretion system ATPase GspE [Serratia proteamaculans]QQX51246.1 type II secretion system ATPase GspE [Serratia proteamaculans]